jgi:excisionase family DNA binding protein
MQDATVGSQDAPTAGYSLQEAATLLGIGVNTLRRRIAAGQIQAAQVQRPQGYVWRVYLDGRHPPPRSLPQPPTALAQADALASLIQATLTPIIAPLVGQLDAQRQTIER